MKTERIKIATNTLEILDRGHYTNSKGITISIKDEVKTSIESSFLYTPHALDLLNEKISTILAEIITSTRFDVVNATTLQAAQELSSEGATDILVLNFASAKNPGGGFLNGSQAQEESIARSSGLYPTLLKNSEMYRVNKAHGSCLYTENMIYSPSVPVLKDDDGKLLDSPYLISVITSPAVNSGAIKRNEPENIRKIEPVMIGRIEKVLSVAVAHGHKNIILGAWGCGVFENDPQLIATYFGLHLIEGRFKNKFNRVIFAIKSNDERFIAPFKRLFPNKLSS
jgi:uncharacterized protein (TIGR02452 family)